jgi:hypothetical protein
LAYPCLVFGGKNSKLIDLALALIIVVSNDDK